MKISNYSLNINTSYSSEFADNNIHRTQTGMNSLARTKKTISNSALDSLVISKTQTDQIDTKQKIQASSGNLIFNALSQKTSLSTSGTIETENGTFTFDLQSSLRSSHINIRNSRTIDPIIIGINGALPEFTSKTMDFDINSDGKAEQIAALKKGAGYLAIDKNNNGKIDNGSELIGTQNGGFEELAAYDDDKNGFIDENDAIYEKLKVWSKDGTIDSIESLKDANVGAIYAGGVENDYEYIIDGNTVVRLTGSSVAISETGHAMSVSQVELVVNDSSNSNAQGSAPQENTATTSATQDLNINTQENTSKAKNDEEQSSSLSETLSSSIESQIERLEKQETELTSKVQYAATPEEAKEFTQRLSIVKGQISVLKASLFKIEKETIDQNA